MAATQPRSISAPRSAWTTSPARPTACPSPSSLRPKRRSRATSPAARAKADPNTVTSLADLRAGGKPALAAILAELETNPDDDNVVALLTEAFLAPLGQVIGLTGPPGVGKSTLAGAIINATR